MGESSFANTVHSTAEMRKHAKKTVDENIAAPAASTVQTTTPAKVATPTVAPKAASGATSAALKAASGATSATVAGKRPFMV
jgi:hypothetical protein